MSHSSTKIHKTHVITDHIKSISLKSFIGGTGSLSLFTSLVLFTSGLPLNRFPLVTAHYHLLQQTFKTTLEVQTSLQHLYNMLVSKTFIIKTEEPEMNSHYLTCKWRSSPQSIMNYGTVQQLRNEQWLYCLLNTLWVNEKLLNKNKKKKWTSKAGKNLTQELYVWENLTLLSQKFWWDFKNLISYTGNNSPKERLTQDFLFFKHNILSPLIAPNFTSQEPRVWIHILCTKPSSSIMYSHPCKLQNVCHEEACYKML